MRGDRRDSNEADMVRDLRKIGGDWIPFRSTGRKEEKGFPDGVACLHFNVLVQIKKPGEKLTPEQEDFHRNWPGPIGVARTTLELFELVGYRDKGAFVEATLREVKP